MSFFEQLAKAAVDDDESEDEEYVPQANEEKEFELEVQKLLLKSKKITKQRRRDDLTADQIYLEIRQPSSILGDIVKQFKEIFYQKYKTSYDFKQKRQLLKKQDCKFVTAIRKKLVEDILILIDFMKKIFVFTYTETLSFYFREQQELDLRCHSLMLRVAFQDSRFYSFVETVLKYELKYEEQASRYYQQSVYQSITLKELGIENKALENLKNPFSQTIEMMKIIQKASNPWSKLFRIGKIRKSILDEIDRDNPQQQIQLSSDDFLNIIIFCMVKSKKSNWIRQHKIIEYFLPEEIMYTLEDLSMYLCKFEMAAEYIRQQGENLIKLGNYDCENMDSLFNSYNQDSGISTSYKDSLQSSQSGQSMTRSDKEFFQSLMMNASFLPPVQN